MTINEAKNYICDLNVEIDIYREKCLEQTKQEIYDSNYEIRAYEEIYTYLINNVKDMNLKYLPKNDILNTFYYHFMKTSYNLTNEDLGYFFDDEKQDAKQYKLYQADEEM